MRSAVSRVCIFVLAFVSFQVLGAELDSRTQQRVRAATFEVVVPKPTNDTLTYEKPLPMELLPYLVRNDQYEPRGTAFAFKKNQYVTAAHVFQLGSRSQRATPMLRDGSGHVY